MKNCIAIKTNCFKGFQKEQTFQGIVNAGFQNVEVSLSIGSNTGIDRNCSLQQRQEFRKYMQQLGLNVIGVGGHVDITNPQLDQDFIANVQLAHFLKAQYIVISVGASNKDERDLSNEFVAENIRRFLPILKQENVKLILETHWKHASGAKLKPICDLVNDPYCKIGYDCGNVVFYEGLSNQEILEDFRNCISQVGYIHLKDKIGPKLEWNFPALGQGQLPLKELVQLIKEYQLDCPIVAEIEHTATGVSNIEQANKAAKISYEFLKELNL